VELINVRWLKQKVDDCQISELELSMIAGKSPLLYLTNNNTFVSDMENDPDNQIRNSFSADIKVLKKSMENPILCTKDAPDSEKISKFFVSLLFFFEVNFYSTKDTPLHKFQNS
jgi:hypothetical protein